MVLMIMVKDVTNNYGQTVSFNRVIRFIEFIGCFVIWLIDLRLFGSWHYAITYFTFYIIALVQHIFDNFVAYTVFCLDFLKLKRV